MSKSLPASDHQTFGHSTIIPKWETLHHLWNLWHAANIHDSQVRELMGVQLVYSAGSEPSKLPPNEPTHVERTGWALRACHIVVLGGTIWHESIKGDKSSQVRSIAIMLVVKSAGGCSDASWVFSDSGTTLGRTKTKAQRDSKWSARLLVLIYVCAQPNNLVDRYQLKVDRQVIQCTPWDAHLGFCLKHSEPPSRVTWLFS